MKSAGTRLTVKWADHMLICIGVTKRKQLHRFRAKTYDVNIRKAAGKKFKQ